MKPDIMLLPEGMVSPSLLKPPLSSGTARPFGPSFTFDINHIALPVICHVNLPLILNQSVQIPINPISLSLH